MTGPGPAGRRVRRVGLTGGIGAGKSAASAALARRGAVVVDADLLAREVVAPGTPGLAAVAGAFGPGVLRPDGALDRPALAAVVFADPRRRAELDALVHPRVRALAAEREAAAPDGAVVVHDVPLLVETGQEGSYDLVVVVDAPVELQVRRLVEGRGMDEEQARARVAAQAGRERRLAAADVVLDGSGDLAALEEQVERLWARLVSAEG
ncbi:dephospho-CoA kinase [Vallicoccus soli]|uniref:Dephospho-CoA kinase n=1 Tax=Vallicoccus soli TaxID=2339232 RepID=A0A3A3YU11_9ACTN|nr:dephospho-CoA kinase [Vallicoccus soli]RJK93739.1 dephospho-CoA kinase [Vallicoccus soli]